MPARGCARERCTDQSPFDTQASQHNTQPPNEMGKLRNGADGPKSSILGLIPSSSLSRILICLDDAGSPLVHLTRLERRGILLRADP